MTRLFLVLSLPVILVAQTHSYPGIDDSLSFSTPSAPRISPDGTRVVYQLSRTNWEDNAFESDLWLCDVAAPGHPRLMTAGPGWNGEPRWSPDGRQIAFVSDRSGRREIFVISPPGGEARKLTSAENGVNAFRWAPDGKSIAFTSDDDGDSHKKRTERYGDFEIVNSEAPSASLWRVRIPDRPEAAPGAPELLTKGRKEMIGAFAWSPDGSKIAFESDGIHILDVAAATTTTIASGSGPYRNPVWSPDGRYVAFETAGGDPGFYYSNWFIAKAPAEGGPTEPLTKGFDENADLCAWTTAGIFFGALQRTAAHLFVLDPMTRDIRRVTGPAETTNLQFSVSADGAHYAFVRGSSSELMEVCAAPAGGNAVQLTDASAQLANFRTARPEVIRWKSTDGTEIEGILYKPAHFDPLKKYPLLVVIHGGPVAVDEPVIRPDRLYPIEDFVAAGALVLRPNYRGSAGYGAKFRALPVRNLGTGDAADIVSGVDSLILRGFVDPDRVGAMGWSEGGYISEFLAAATNRFRAVSAGAAISDWLTYYSSTDITPFTRQYLKSTPWQSPETYRKASPVTYINQANTPVLIQHGDQDRRVPIANAWEFRQALEDRNVPVRMIVYKGFGHSIDRPKQQRAVMEHNLEWFTQWIFGGKAVPSPVNISAASAGRVTGDSQ